MLEVFPRYRSALSLLSGLGMPTSFVAIRSGPIPSTIGNLSNLNKLRLESNQLSGGSVRQQPAKDRVLRCLRPRVFNPDKTARAPCE